MNYMKQVAEMLGVAIRERFDIKSGETIIQECYIDTLGLHEEATYGGMPKLLLKLLNGNAEILKKPFRPNCNEEYWFVNCDGDVEGTIVDGGTFDLMAIYMGNCFRAESEAEAHKDEIMAKFQEVMGDDRA